MSKCDLSGCRGFDDGFWSCTDNDGCFCSFEKTEIEDAIAHALYRSRGGLNTYESYAIASVYLRDVSLRCKGYFYKHKYWDYFVWYTLAGAATHTYDTRTRAAIDEDESLYYYIANKCTISRWCDFCLGIEVGIEIGTAGCATLERIPSKYRELLDKANAVLGPSKIDFYT